MARSLITSIAIAAAIAGLVLSMLGLVANRRHIRRLKAAGVPMPDFHPVFGHFKALKEAIEKFPRNVTMHVVVQHLSKRFASDGIFYLNLWPFLGKTIIVVSSPHLAAQVETASPMLGKPAEMCGTIEVINGGASLMTMHGAAWKRWRGLFSPGFATGYMTQLAPAVAEEVDVFCDILRGLARKGEMVQLEEYTLRLTFDVIARVTLDARLHYQTQGSALADCLRRQVYWTPFGTSFNPVRRYLSPRPLVQKYNSWRMNQYLDVEIEKRFEELVASRSGGQARAEAQAQAQSGSSRTTRSIISLAMDKYLSDVRGKAGSEGKGEEEKVSKEAFKEMAKPQLRMFLYAGHDTTSSTLLYCFLLLAQHPAVMAKMRAEHDQVFGGRHDSSSSSADPLQLSIEKDPALLNQIPYTLAVIKEVLRLFPPAGSMREGRDDFVLVDEKGRLYPIEDCHIWTLSLAMHHDPAVFERAEEFVPDRWLHNDVNSEFSTSIQKGAWRPFEFGPRNCIGQTLAQLELKVALVMTARLFDITPAYDEWDALHPPKQQGKRKRVLNTVDGNRAYQSEMGGGGAHPVDGFPVRIRLRE